MDRRHTWLQASDPFHHVCHFSFNATVTCPITWPKTHFNSTCSMCFSTCTLALFIFLYFSTHMMARYYYCMLQVPSDWFSEPYGSSHFKRFMVLLTFCWSCLWQINYKNSYLFTTAGAIRSGRWRIGLWLSNVLSFLMWGSMYDIQNIQPIY